MKSYLKSHPFAVEAFFESSLVLTFAVRAAELKSKIPACLTLDTFKDEWAFIAVAMVQTKNLRPKGFPAFMGNDFFSDWLSNFCTISESDRKAVEGLVYLKI